MTRTISTKRLVRTALTVAAASVFLSGCGGGGDSPTTTSTPVASAMAVNTGDGQTARINSTIAAVPSVVVRDQRGVAMAGVAVTFSVASGGGTVTGSSAVTDANGQALAGAWTMGRTPGANTLRATANAGTNPSVTINATARLPRWTVMVYMAADNNLAAAGLADLNEMEAIGAYDEVQIVVQGEFSKSNLSQYGVTSASQLHLPSWNTFRYVLPTGASATNPVGPNGLVQDIGNRNMTSPGELSAFVTWATQNTPAERYALVLWNHGNGAAGLLADETSNPGNLMTLAQLRSALAAGPKLDVTVFDMCLMATVETVAAISGLSKAAVFSEEVVPGDGYDYREMIRTFNQQQSATAENLASALVDAFFASYATNPVPSLTMSAVSVDAAGPLLAAVSTMSTALQGRLPVATSLIASGVVRSQRFTAPVEKDLADASDSVRAQVSDAPTRAAIDAVKAQLGSTLVLLKSRSRTGTSSNAVNVQRARGISITWPSGGLLDAFATEGPNSLASYSQNAGSGTWPAFLASYLATAQNIFVLDTGTQALNMFIVWNQAAFDQGADLDLFVFEPSPDGNGWLLYSPSLGTVSPNGQFTPDSYYSGYPVEGWITNRFVQRGVYYFGAYLYADPANQQPYLNVAYRFGFAADFSVLYATNQLPRFDRSRPFASDPTPTMTKLLADAYSDFRIVSNWDNTAAPAATLAEMLIARDARADGTSWLPLAAPSAGKGAAALSLSAPQMAALRALQRARTQGIREHGVLESRVIEALRPFMPRQ